MRETSTRLLLVAAGIAFGVAISIVIQPSKTTAQSILDARIYQILGAGDAIAVVWRLNTVTGRLELCFASNYSSWAKGHQSLPGARDPDVPLWGRCDMMPAPSN